MDLTPHVHSLFSSFVFGTFSLYTPLGSGVGRRDPTMLIPKSSCVCIPCIKSVAPRVYMAKVKFLAYFWPDMNTEMGVVIYT